MSNRSSTLITNRDTNAGLTDPSISGAMGRVARGYVSSTTGDIVGSLYKLLSVPSICSLADLNLIVTVGLGTGVTGSIGLYYASYVPLIGGTAVNSQTAFFASAQTLATAITTPTNVLNSAGNYGPDKQEQPLWQAAGLTADPECFFDIAIVTAGATTTATGLVQLRAAVII